jgi:hypothetical protein
MRRDLLLIGCTALVAAGICCLAFWLLASPAQTVSIPVPILLVATTAAEPQPASPCEQRLLENPVACDCTAQRDLAGTGNEPGAEGAEAAEPDSDQAPSAEDLPGPTPDSGVEIVRPPEFDEAFMLLRERKYREAQRLLRSCLRRDSSAAGCHMLLGTVYARTAPTWDLHDPLRLDAVYHYSRFVELDPDGPYAERAAGLLNDWVVASGGPGLEFHHDEARCEAALDFLQEDPSL